MKSEVETMNKNQLELRNDIAKIKNTLEVFNCKLEEAEKWISELEDKVEKILRAANEEKIKKQGQFRRTLEQREM